jgi:hypothetical protein
VRTAFVHVGTHKTGTKALQVFCAMNREALGSAGIHYPVAGRVPMGTGSTPGHHQIAFDLMRSSESPSLAAALAEIDAAGPPSVLLSSEEFHMLLGAQGRLEAIARGFRSRDYRPVAILYLRPQGEYAESLYAEFLKGGRLTDFRSYFDEILETGAFLSADARQTTFQYSQLIEGLAEVFSPSDVVIRPYRGGRKPEALFADFLNVIAHVSGTPIGGNFDNPMPRANASLTFRALADRVCTLAGGKLDLETFFKRRYPNVGSSLLDKRFSLLTQRDVARFRERFAEDNRRVNAMCGAGLPTANDLPDDGDRRFERAEIHREILAALFDEAFG